MDRKTIKYLSVEILPVLVGGVGNNWYSYLILI